MQVTSDSVKVKRLEAGSYLCEFAGKKFTVYRVIEHGWRNNALKRPNRFGVYHNVMNSTCAHWAFNLNDGRGSFGGYGTRDQAIEVAIRSIG